MQNICHDLTVHVCIIQIVQLIYIFNKYFIAMVSTRKINLGKKTICSVDDICIWIPTIRSSSTSIGTMLCDKRLFHIIATPPFLRLELLHLPKQSNSLDIEFKKYKLLGVCYGTICKTAPFVKWCTIYHKNFFAILPCTTCQYFRYQM